MNNTMQYQDYVGSVEFSEADGVFYGKVMGIRALLSYEGETAQELVSNFHSTVEDYLALCEETGIQPEKAYKGSFNVRVSSDLHRQAAVRAASEHISLNSLVETALQRFLYSGS